MTVPAHGALEGLRIVDLTQFLAGPFCTQMLADQGAEVIKVESLIGDDTRRFGPFLAEDGLQAFAGYFASVNRNKSPIALDLKTEAGRAILLDLVETADAVVENFRAGVMDRLGLSYETMRARNKRIVYAAIRGFGDTRVAPSPYVDWPAYDVVAQAMGGVMAITGAEGGDPMKVGPGVGDLVPGAMCAFGIVSAIYRAGRTGEGQFVDVSMVDSMLALSERILHQHAFGGVVPVPIGNHHPFVCPFGMFPTSDGFCAIAAFNDAMFPRLCRAIGMEAALSDPRFATIELRYTNRVALIALLSSITSRHSKQALIGLLGGLIPFGPVYQVDEILTDPHFRAREMIVAVEQPGTDRSVLLAGTPVKMSETPGQIWKRAPLLGEDTEAVLMDLGRSADEIAALRSAGIIGVAVAYPDRIAVHADKTITGVSS